MKNSPVLASRHSLLVFSVAALGVVAGLCSCANGNLATRAGVSDATTRALRSKVDTIVVIYAENRAFDNLYGNFPGAHGLNEVVDPDGRPSSTYAPQIDRNGSLLPILPP